ncbi:fasciclin domain-containing protein [Candidatus Gracilibacteria bacterium]|nr:fasciclin domain-containing protein [Candidatus Gracilibacteria bacterium]NJM87725.1 fasciclin domain-containing protein [Hydrococcus sp. RU_2_2]NJP19432.1 fasciclin domain-containing protein [Hydrococcus sp. CRU_1_1]
MIHLLYTKIPASIAIACLICTVGLTLPLEARSNTCTEVASKNSTDNIVDIATSNDSFSTLAAAIEAAGLRETLSSSNGSFTVFAPTDEAFAALPEGTLEELLKPENRDELVKILTYHVVPGRVTSEQLSNGSVETVEGQSVTVDVGEREIKVNDSNVIRADILASNGVIHVIDRVLIPPQE